MYMLSFVTVGLSIRAGIIYAALLNGLLCNWKVCVCVHACVYWKSRAQGTGPVACSLDWGKDVSRNVKLSEMDIQIIAYVLTLPSPLRESEQVSITMCVI